MDVGLRQRIKFSRRTYLFVVAYLLLAIVQWLVVCLIDYTRDTFRDSEIICFINFILAIILFLVFVLVEQVRHIKIVNYILAFVIVELHIISLFVLVARTWVPEIIGYFLICLGFFILFLTIGCNLPFSMDLTVHVAHLFILTFILLIVSVYFLIMHLHLTELIPYAFLLFEMSLSVVAFLFVMLHAQTIKGDRYAQMSNRDTLLASLILFHEFLIVYTLTFYWQINYAYFTPEEYSLLTESSKQESIRLNYADYGDETDNEPAPAEISEANVDANGPSERTIVFAPVIEARVGDAEAWNGTGTHRENGNAITDSTDKSPKIPLNGM